MALSAAHGITLSHGGYTVLLRPSLRAAVTLERLHDGFVGLFRQLRDFDTATITTVIEVAATDHEQGHSLLASVANEPLKGFYQDVQLPLVHLCQSLIPATRSMDENASGVVKPMAWADFYKALYRTATGWLQWPPEAAWNATPDEITEAFDGLLEKLKAIHGGVDDNKHTDDQREENIAAGLDPEFDRDGLRALKAKLTEGTPR